MVSGSNTESIDGAYGKIVFLFVDFCDVCVWTKPTRDLQIKKLYHAMSQYIN